MKLLWLLAAILVLAASWVVYADEPEELWADDLNKALSRAQKSNKPVLLVIRNAHSVASIDVGHWLKDIEYAEHVGRFEPAMVWEGHPSLQTLHLHGRPALVFLTAKGELISSEEAPQFRAQMKERLDGVLLNPVPLDKLYENCLVEMKKGADSPTIDTTNFKRTIEILRATGNADRALPLQQVLNGVKLLKKAEAAKAAAAAAPPASEELKEKPPEREEEFQKKEGETDKEAKERQKKEKKEREKREKELKEKEKKEKKEKEKREKEQGDKKSEATLPEAASEEDEPIEFLEAEARQHVAGHLVRAVRTIEAFSSGEKPENRPPHVLLKAGVARAAQVMNREDANSVKAVTDADAALDAYAKESSDENLKNARKALGVLVPGLNAAAGALQKQANDIFEKFYKANPEHWRTKFNAYTQVWREYNKSRDLEKVRAAMAAVIGAPMSREVLAEVAGHLMNGVIQLELDTERALIAERLQRELTTGRGAADVFLDLADLAVERGQREDAFKLYGMAEQAADGESPVLYRTVRAMRALVDGKGSPNETRWAKRDVKDVVVLVEDYEGYLQAISQWTDKEFFPVLFADDLYAPKFVAAFKPAQVVFWPAAERERSKGGPGPVPSIDQIRKTLLQSWSTDGEKKGPETVTDADLLARLKKLDAKSMGVVFGDGESGEMAGGIALAAGRFQGFEVLPRPTVGGENKIGDTEHYMDVPRITALARKVAEGLQKWGLPSESRWATVTLAGRYPFRFIGVPSAWGYGTTYTVDDLLGRGEDMMRLAVTSRLMGDAPRSAYQAMCSMFLQPETALLFNTYGYDPNNRNVWGAYRMHFAEEAYKARLKLTHIQSDKATPETFREQVLPWNRNDLIMINSSGGPYSWGLTGGNGTGEDMPVGAPCAIHVTHSGSAGELYDPESMAGRAVWGGAFWYFGSAAEPFLTAFQPSRYYAPRIMAGASLSTVFRQRAGQNFFLPWRLLIVGDPQFCLRDKPARRVGADGLIAALPKGAKTIQPARADAEARQMGEKFDVSCTAAEFTAQLRRARQLGNSFLGQGETFLASTDLKQLDARGTAMVLEELLKVDQTQKAVAVWRDASAEVKKDEVAKRVARLAAGRHMDKALAGKNLKELCQAFGDLLSTDPPRNYVERWTARAGTLAAELKADGELGAWMMSIASDARAASHKPFFLFEALKKKNEWTVEEKATSLTGFQSFVKELREDWTLGGPFKEFCDLYLAKVKDATGETLLADLRLLFPAGTEDEKKVAPHMKSLEQRMSLHQDWLILGPFKDQAAGAWEKVGPKAGAAAPDYNAVFNDGKELKWTRPFKPEQKGVVDLAKLLNPNTNVYAYGAVEVEVEKDIDGFLLIGSDDGVTAWLDGKEVHKNIVARGLQIDQDRVPVKLTAGTHTLVVCITQGGGGWEFCARFGDGEGKPLPGVKMKCPLK